MLELMKSFFNSYGYDEALKRYCQNEWKNQPLGHQIHKFEQQL